jgi:uncharacterized membrane protein
MSGASVLDAHESTNLATVVMGAVAAWMLSNPGGVVGAVCAVISCVVLVRKYREESKIRKVEIELKNMQLEEMKAAQRLRDEK